MTNALFIGRFQPFHNGHLSVVRKALEEVDHLLIGIGSAEDNFLPDNPFTASERYQMIDAALERDGILRDKYAIIPVRNIDNYDLWVDHVALLVPPFTKVYTGSEIVKTLFEKHGGYEIVDVKKEIPVSATEVRELMKKGEDWQSFVPKAVKDLIEEWKGVERLKKIDFGE